jgi:hypothetical protein
MRWIAVTRSREVMLGGFLAAAVVPFALSPAVTANGLEVGRDAGMVFPVASDSVQLVSEDVSIRLPAAWSRPGEATCRYVLRNLARTQRDFEMAFVANPPFAPTADGYRAQYSHARFDVSLDGSPIEVRYAPVADGQWRDFVRSAPDSLPVWRITLAPGATAQVHMCYDVSWSGGSDGGHSSTGLTYHARPAALWAGRLESATIRFELDPLAALILECAPQLGECFSFSIEPPGYKWYDGRFEWRYEDWKPDTDFSFGYEVYREMP